MTRVNVIPVNELSDQWLISEYRELPRCIKQDIDTSDAPTRYCLGKGHMKWAKKHSIYLFRRYRWICEEMEYRGFTVNYPAEKFYTDYINTVSGINLSTHIISNDEIELNRKRLIEKYKMKPNFYKWTKRDKPNWIMKGVR